MSESPSNKLLRYGQVLDLLAKDYDVPRWVGRQLIENKTIPGKPLVRGGRKFYRASDAIAAVVNGSSEEKAEVNLEARKPGTKARK